MTLKIKVVDVNYVHKVWPDVEKFILNAIATNDKFPEWSKNYNIEHIKAFITSGQWLLLVAMDEQGGIRGCATVSFINYPMHRVAFISTLGGKFVSTREVYEQLKSILKELGATKIQCFGRESVIRLWRRFDFEPRNMLVEALL